MQNNYVFLYYIFIFLYYINIIEYYFRIKWIKWKINSKDYNEKIKK